jgi:ribosomal protein S18 acetylase RimI-like enzyme
LVEDEWEVFRDVRLAALIEAPDAFSARFEDENQRTETEWRAKVTDWARFVIELDGRVVGMVSGGPSNRTGAAVLTSLWVDPSARGMGIGDRLVQTVVERSKAEGFGLLLLWVAEGNIHAERLYERNGFSRTGEVIQQPKREFEMSKQL